MLILKTGIKGQAQVKVVEENTAKIMKSGALPVFATPAMVALMEEASCMALKDYLEEGEGTVGIKLDISHIAPTALDDVVTATATLDKIDVLGQDYRAKQLAQSVYRNWRNCFG